ncbi:hypothetical protein QCE63_20420 [Caballeronia sp. LZ065]|uniref:hypothetical protein n=1 Tax=Caballeronia sp. LZ065 TaxID=3038571 RepID=UPI002861388C|nr:hypothetical protein [Caballeronia sp. LZ065]MDR5781768.1 hypothetical protein [Caballeronia sp. LZ065]
MRYRLFVFAALACLLAIAAYLISNTHKSAAIPPAVSDQPQASAGPITEAANPNPNAGEQDADEAHSKLAEKAAADFKTALAAKYGSSVLQH